MQTGEVLRLGEDTATSRNAKCKLIHELTHAEQLCSANGKIMNKFYNVSFDTCFDVEQPAYEAQLICEGWDPAKAKHLAAMTACLVCSSRPVKGTLETIGERSCQKYVDILYPLVPASEPAVPQSKPTSDPTFPNK